MSEYFSYHPTNYWVYQYIYSFLKLGIRKSPWVSVLTWSSMTWMIWGYPDFRSSTPMGRTGDLQYRDRPSGFIQSSIWKMAHNGTIYDWVSMRSILVILM